MDKRTAVFLLAGIVFVGHVLSERDNGGSSATLEAKPLAFANAAHADADKVAVDVFNIMRGGAGVSIHNVSGQRLASVFLECTFRNQDGSRIDSVPIFVSNLAAGDTANESAQMPNDITASTVDCRTDYAYAG
jgi:hypothetical protein